MLRELEDLESQYPQFITPDSPTSRVGESATTPGKAVNFLQTEDYLIRSFKTTAIIAATPMTKNKTKTGSIDLLEEICCNLKLHTAGSFPAVQPFPLM